MAGIVGHPAPGPNLGDLIPGWFSVPQNPVRDGTEVRYTPHMGDVLASKYRVPHNPLIEQVRAGLHGCSAEDAGPMRFTQGMVSAPEADEPTPAGPPVPLWVHIAAGGLVVGLLMSSLGGRRR